MSRKKRKFLKTAEQKTEKAVVRESKPNPFELRVNRKKHDVIGQKVRGERGHVVKSRTIATERRRRTLLPQLQQKDKVNAFVDRRFGENDANMTLEEKMLLRFAVERKKRHEKAGLYNLNDGEDEELTHLGRSLAEIDEFTERDLRLTDDEGEGGGFDARTTEDLHFGGFERPDSDPRPKTRKEVMQEIIAKSKLHKLERQKEREEQEDKTDALDKELQFLMRQGLLVQRNRHEDKIAEQAVKADDYDKAVRSLGFEARAQATDRMRSDEDKAKEQLAKLQQLEAVRRARMRDEDPSEQDARGVDPSVEELGGNVALEEDTEVYYEDGVLMKDGQRLDLRLKAVKRRPRDEAGDVEEEGRPGASSDAEDGSGDDETDGSEEEDDDDEDEEDEDEDEKASDLELGAMEGSHEASSGSDDDNKDDSTGGWRAIAARMAARTQTTAPQPNVRILNIGSGRETKPKVDASDLPYTFTAPGDLGEWLELVEECSAKDVLTIMVRMRACHHVKLHPDNRAKMELFFRILMEYAVYLCESKTAKPGFTRTVLDKLPIVLFAMAADMPQCAAEVFREELQVAANALTKALQKTARARVVPARTLLVLQYIVLLYPTSDLRHAVTTPAMYLMAQILSHMPVNSPDDVCVLLFITSLSLAFVRDSKRFVPEAVNVLAGVLDRFATCNGVGASSALSVQSVPTLAHMPDNVLRFKDEPKVKQQEKPDAKLNVWASWGLNGADHGLEGDALTVAIVDATLRMTEQCVELWGELKCFNDIAAPLHAHAARVAQVSALAHLQAHAASVDETLTAAREKCIKNRTHMMAQKRKPIPLRQFNPKFEDKYVVGQSFDPDKERREARKLKHLYKRELKGAKREIIKDSAFIARERYRLTKELDADRNTKTKRLFSLLQDTQAEANEQKRLKKKLKGKQ